MAATRGRRAAAGELRAWARPHSTGELGHPLLTLQRQAGNAAVCSLLRGGPALQRQTTRGGTATSGMKVSGLKYEGWREGIEPTPGLGAQSYYDIDGLGTYYAEKPNLLRDKKSGVAELRFDPRNGTVYRNGKRVGPAVPKTLKVGERLSGLKYKGWREDFVPTLGGAASVYVIDGLGTFFAEKPNVLRNQKTGATDLRFDPRNGVVYRNGKRVGPTAPKPSQGPERLRGLKYKGWTEQFMPGPGGGGTVSVYAIVGLGTFFAEKPNVLRDQMTGVAELRFDPRNGVVYRDGKRVGPGFKPQN